MRDLLSWNISLGRWGGVQLRLHVFFVLFALVALLLVPSGANQKLFWETTAVLGIFLVSVLLHEIGHTLAAWRVGGSVDQIVLWPLGGLTQVNLSHDPQSEWIIAITGPLVNVGICLLTTLVLVAERFNPVDLLNPLLPPVEPAGLTWLNACQWLLWINWLLFLVNCLPALPFDGGRALRALLWMHHDFRQGVVLAARVAQVVALLLWVVAVFIHRSGAYSFAALPFVLVGILLFFSAKQEIDRLNEAESDDALFGYDFSQGYTSLEKAAPSRKPAMSPVRKWLDDRRTRRLERQRQLEAEEERRVDEVLARLHDLGMHGLSEDERALLNRVSARYRSRHRP
ncbi:MAG TPA: site-2 protease family protein [Pirellulales bacterium]|nr:site-2 protease family protein [Pirellulales bacterium]